MQLISTIRSSAITTFCMNREAIRLIPQVQYFPAGRSFWHPQAVYGYNIRALGQHYHALVLALATIGFLPIRRSGSLVFVCRMLVTFVLIRMVLEVNDRYHFAAQSILAIGAAFAFGCPNSGGYEMDNRCRQEYNRSKDTP